MSPPITRTRPQPRPVQPRQQRASDGQRLATPPPPQQQRFAGYDGRSWFLPSASRPGAPPLTGDLRPGGRFDPTRVGDDQPGTQTLFAQATWGFPSYTQSGHHYALLSDPLPRGTSYAQANDALQRFNAPTAAAWRGEPGDTRSTGDTVTSPGGIPAGTVRFTRGDGWVRNTTDWSHALIGTITRRVVRAQNGELRILTEGEGRGGPFGGIRHRANIRGALGIPGGPEIFSRMDDITINYLRRRQPVRP